jgi:hypothetical protein
MSWISFRYNDGSIILEISLGSQDAFVIFMITEK